MKYCAYICIPFTDGVACTKEKKKNPQKRSQNIAKELQKISIKIGNNYKISIILNRNIYAI